MRQIACNSGHQEVLASRNVTRCLYWLLGDWDCSVLTGGVYPGGGCPRPLHT